MLGLLSNEKLPRGINWTLLSDPLYRELASLAATRRIAPPPFGLGSLGEYMRSVGDVRGCDALFAMHGSARAEYPLMALSALGGRKQRAVFFVDPWPQQLEKIAQVNRLYGVETAFVPYAEALPALRKLGGATRYVHLPFAADTRCFAPQEADRDIDILWMGRRYEPLHRAILDYAEREGLTYLYRERMGFIEDPFELGALAARSRYFVVTPSDLDGPERSGGFSPLVMRYLEGLAAGCRLLGVLPRSGEFEAILPREAVLEVAPGGGDFAEIFAADQGIAEGWAASAEAGEIVRCDHSWAARARTIVAELGLISA